jgi:hypothetical protein
MFTKSTVSPKERSGLVKRERCLYPQQGTNLRMAVERAEKNHAAVQLLLRKTCCISPESNLSVTEPQ